MCLNKKLVVLSLGGNLGDSLDIIQMAYNKIEENIGEILEKSSFYKSPPWGFKAENDFINSAILIETILSPEKLLMSTKAVEKELGRGEKLEVGYESRPIDIDIIDYDSQIINKKNLVIPHMLMHERCFVLLPIQEILPDWQHPILKKNVHTLIMEITDIQKVKKM